MKEFNHENLACIRSGGLGADRLYLAAAWPWPRWSWWRGPIWRPRSRWPWGSRRRWLWRPRRLRRARCPPLITATHQPPQPACWGFFMPATRPRWSHSTGFFKARKGGGMRAQGISAWKRAMDRGGTSCTGLSLLAPEMARGERANSGYDFWRRGGTGQPVPACFATRLLRTPYRGWYG